MIFQTTVERRKAQNTMLYIWLFGAVLSFVLWQLFLKQYLAAPADYSIDSNDLSNALERIRKKYQDPLVAIYSPWLSVMLAGFLFGNSAIKVQQITRDVVMLSVILSLALQMMIVFAAYSFLKQPEISVFPFEPLPALFVSLIGTVVTFTFPEQKQETETTPGNNSTPTEAGAVSPHSRV